MEYDYIKCGDCLELMKDIPDESIDLILCDLPYGITYCKWDSIIPFDRLWERYKRVIKQEGAIALFGVQPFVSRLITSNIEMYRYSWVWVKNVPANYLNKRYQPGRLTEEVCIFGKSGCVHNVNNRMKYNPQLIPGKPYHKRGGHTYEPCAANRNAITRTEQINTGTRLPCNVLYYKKESKRFHPTQKPVALLEYLIKTYTDEGGVVLDNCMGSGSTCVAAVNTDRHYIGFELSNEYCKIAESRIAEAQKRRKETVV